MHRPHPVDIIVDDALFPAKVVDAVGRVSQLVGLWGQLALQMALDPGFHNLCAGQTVQAIVLDARPTHYHWGNVAWHATYNVS